MKRRSLTLLAAIAVIASACSSATTETTEQPTSTVDVTGSTEPPEVTAEPGQGGQVTIGLFQEPDNLSPLFAVQTASRVVRDLTLEGLLDADPNGNYIPVLAQEVPNVENGGISEDGLTVTYVLKDGLTWSDGHPVTSRDVQFTWEAIMDPGNAVTSTAGYDKIASVDTPDEQTVVLNFSELVASALSLFNIPDAVLPAHALEGQDLGTAEFNRIPEGTGPFVVTEWNSGDSIVLDRNPNFREAGKPILDRMVFSIIPSQQVGAARIRSGEIDILWNLDESLVPEFQNADGIDLLVTPSSNVEYLGLNMRDRQDPSQPSPFFSDKRVRDALAMAIDRRPIIDDLLLGLTEPATSPIGLGWAAPEGLEFPAYDPAGAMALLEEAEWVDGDGDGIREKDGRKLSFEISTPAGQQLRELTEQILQQQFAAVGAELVINNVPAATLFGSWEENGKLKRGDFEIVMDTWGADLDPDAFLSILFTSEMIPSEANNGDGWNFFGLSDPELDAAIRAGASTIDQDARKEAYRVAVERILEAGVYIPLYKRALIDAFSTRVEGESSNPWAQFTWNAADWSLAG